jgi:hypothetical protein
MKLGLIVEGDSHKAILERLVPRLTSPPSPIRYAFIRLGGREALSTAYTSAVVLLGKKYDHVIITFDTYTGQPEGVAELEERVAAGVRQFGLEQDVSICPAVPELRAFFRMVYWLAVKCRRCPHRRNLTGARKPPVRAREGTRGTSKQTTPMTRHHPEKRSSSWLLAGLPGQDPNMFDPKGSLGAMLGKTYSAVADGPALADRIDIRLAEQRSPSFTNFARAIRSVVSAEATAAH